METLVSTLTGLPLAVPTTADPGGFGLGLDKQYSLSYFRGLAWYYEGETMGYRVVFAYWPQYDLVITAVANSNVPQSTFPKTVLPAALDALIDTGAINQW
jgi:D-alanyl-D-alanine carboxypeptidase